MHPYSILLLNSYAVLSNYSLKVSLIYFIIIIISIYQIVNLFLIYCLTFQYLITLCGNLKIVLLGYLLIAVSLKFQFEII